MEKKPNAIKDKSFGFAVRIVNLYKFLAFQKNEYVLSKQLLESGISIGENPETLKEVYEPFLIQEGFIIRTPRGREVTEKAYKHLGISRPKNPGELF